jgi:hypothetical protein
MKRLVKNLIHGSSKARARRSAPRLDRHVRPQIECLEDRQVPTILFHPVYGAETAVDNGGNKLSSPNVYLIFNSPGNTWGDINTQQPSAAAAAILNAFNNLCNSTYFDGLQQYGSDGQAILGGFRIDNTLLMSHAFQTKQIDDLIDNQVDNFLPDDSKDLYVVITDPGVRSGDPRDPNGYHFSSDLPEAWVRTPGNLKLGSQAFIDQVTVTLSHEVFEAMSDPFLDGITVIPGAGWKGGGSMEIGDQEPDGRYLYRVNGTLAQAYWSQADGAYLVDDGTGILTHQVFDVTGTVLTVNGDQIFLPTNDDITVGTSPTGGVTVNLNGDVATFEKGMITSIVINPGGSFNGYNHVNVEATNVPVTINDVDPRGDLITIGKNGVVQGIQATVTINNGPSHFTALTIDDLHDLSPRKIDMTSSDVHIAGAADIQLKGFPLYNLTLVAGGPRYNPSTINFIGNFINISGIAGSIPGNAPPPPGVRPFEGTNVDIYAGPGYDIIRAGDNLDTFKGALGVTGQGHTGFFIYDDTAKTKQTYSLSSSTFSRSGMAHEFVFSGISILKVVGAPGADTGADTFNVGELPFQIYTYLVGGTAGNNTLIGPNATTDWTITGTNRGTLTSGASSVVFKNMQNLQGGTGVDTFQFTMAGTVHTINGGGGGDWLDYSLFDNAHPVIVNLTTGSATGIGLGVKGNLSNIQNVLGGNGGDHLTGGPGGNILIGGGGSDTLVGGPDANLLIGGHGADTVTAGAGGDIVIGGYTDYDSSSDAHRAALQSILNEWRTDASGWRIYRLMSVGVYGQGVNGFNFLNSNTVHHNVADTLNLGAGLDWYFRHLGPNQDTVNGIGVNDQSYDY